MDLRAFRARRTARLPTEADLRRAVAVTSTLARYSTPLAAAYMVSGVVAGTCVAVLGSARQRRELLPRIGSGTLLSAFAMTEPEAGSGASSIRTRVERAGADVRVTGEKLYTTGAMTADQLLVVARRPAEPGRARDPFVIALVPRHAPGVVVEPLPGLADAGATAYPSCRVRFDEVTIRADALLGAEEPWPADAWPAIRLFGTVERILVAAIAHGLASAVAARALAFARERRQFGVPIGTFQAIQHGLVRLATIETTTRLFVDHAVSALRDGLVHEGAAVAAAMAKAVCAEQLQEAVALGMRICGGRAFFETEEMCRLYREAPFTLYAGGTGEIQRLLVARSLGLLNAARGEGH
ncbi:MAG: acyl-CoA dehydrogenase family protein [Gemmatimonadaceae bacterium]